MFFLFLSYFTVVVYAAGCSSPCFIVSCSIFMHVVPLYRLHVAAYWLAWLPFQNTSLADGARIANRAWTHLTLDRTSVGHCESGAHLHSAKEWEERLQVNCYIFQCSSSVQVLDHFDKKCHKISFHTRPLSWWLAQAGVNDRLKHCPFDDLSWMDELPLDRILTHLCTSHQENIVKGSQISSFA